MDDREENLFIRFAKWAAGIRLGAVIFRYPKCLVFSVLVLIQSVYWLTADWSPWPFLILNLVPVVIGRGIFSQWEIVVRQALDPDYDSGILKITIPFVLLNYVAIFACLYMFGTLTDSNGNTINGVWENFFFSAVTLTTLGYGNIVPGDFFTQGVAVIESLVGFMGFAVLAGLCASIVVHRLSLNDH